MVSAPRPLSRLSVAERARSVVGAGGSLAWFADGEKGMAPFYDECGSPMLLTSSAVAARLLSAEIGKITIDVHPRLGRVELAGQFWQLAGDQATAMLEAVHRDHAECPGCDAWQLSRVVGLQVVTVAVRLPGDRRPRPVALDDYIVAHSDPMAAMGANIAAHLNAFHAEDLGVLAARLLRAPVDAVIGAHAGAIDEHGFELWVVDESGGALLTVSLPRPPRRPDALPDAIHDMINAPHLRARRS